MSQSQQTLKRKTGRPLSDMSPASKTEHKRGLNRIHQRTHRERQALHRELTIKQIEQQDAVVSFVPDLSEIAPTPRDLGLRVELPLDRDPALPDLLDEACEIPDDVLSDATSDGENDDSNEVSVQSDNGNNLYESDNSVAESDVEENDKEFDEHWVAAGSDVEKKDEECDEHWRNLIEQSVLLQSSSNLCRETENVDNFKTPSHPAQPIYLSGITLTADEDFDNGYEFFSTPPSRVSNTPLSMDREASKDQAISSKPSPDRSRSAESGDGFEILPFADPSSHPESPIHLSGMTITADQDFDGDYGFSSTPPSQPIETALSVDRGASKGTSIEATDRVAALESPRSPSIRISMEDSDEELPPLTKMLTGLAEKNAHEEILIPDSAKRSELEPRSFRQPPSPGFSDDDGYQVHDRSRINPTKSFSRDRSVSSSDPDDMLSDYTDAQIEAANKVLDHFFNFQGCSAETHRTRLQEHQQAHHGQKHRGLEATWKPALPDVLSNPKFLKREDIVRNGVTPEKLRRVWFGQTPDGPGVQKVCLHAEKTEPTTVDVAVDIDSFMGFARSLAVFATGINLTMAASSMKNIKTDLHLSTGIHKKAGNTSPSDLPEEKPLDLRKHSHIYLGYVHGVSRHTAVFIVFPHLPFEKQDEGRNFIALTKPQSKRWHDRILIPAVDTVVPAHTSQYFPRSFDHAEARSYAHQREGRKVETASYGAKRDVQEFVNPEYLGELWEEMLEIIAKSNDLKDFAEPQIFLNAKGTKLYHKATRLRPSFLESADRFVDEINCSFDMRYMVPERFYVDLGVEYCSPHSHPKHVQVPDAERPQVLLWRRCCLQKACEWLHGSGPKGSHTFYHVAFLQDVANLTAVSAQKSYWAKVGLLYYQMYATYKAPLDPTDKWFPFTDKGLEELCLDSEVRKTAAGLAGGRPTNPKVQENAYLGGKSRTAASLHANSPGAARLEGRLVYEDLFLPARAVARARARDGVPLPVTLPEAPPFLVSIDSKQWARFLYHSANKFAYGFEYVRAQNLGKQVTWEQTCVGALFLRQLAYCMIGVNLGQEPALAWTRREIPSTGQYLYGCGLLENAVQSRYGRMMPIIDVKTMTLKKRYRNRILFGNDILRNKYSQYGRKIRPFVDDTQKLESFKEWMGRARPGAEQNLLVQGLIHTCLSAFRRDVMEKVYVERATELLDVDDQAKEKDRIFFSHEGIRAFTNRDPYIVSGGKTKWKSPQEMINLLFGENDNVGNARLRWEHFLFRTLYFKARGILVETLRADDPEEIWRTQFDRALLQHHWLFPYPDPSSGQFMRQTKEKDNRTREKRLM